LSGGEKFQYQVEEPRTAKLDSRGKKRKSFRGVGMIGQGGNSCFFSEEGGEKNPRGPWGAEKKLRSLRFRKRDARGL